MIQIRARDAYQLLGALTLLLGVASCAGPDSGDRSTSIATVQPDSATQTTATTNDTAPGEQISQYIRCIFQDRDGNMWFGTTNDGAIRYDGRSLRYFMPVDGLGSNWVNAIAQDAQGDLWFATSGGVSRYDGDRFTTFTTKDGLADDRVWSMLIDRSGVVWFGTYEGVSRFDGSRLTSFPIPAADLSRFPYYHDPKLINAIIQDKAGNIWFASNGGGAYRYDGSALINVSEKDGLCSNFVQTILEDRDGSLWFGTHSGGVCKYDATSLDKSGRERFTSFTREDLKGDNVGVLYQDQRGTLWMGVRATGLCNYDGRTFTCYSEQDGPGIRVIISMLEDASGQIWFGTGAGLYSFNGSRFTNVTKEELLRK